MGITHPGSPPDYICILGGRRIAAGPRLKVSPTTDHHLSTRLRQGFDTTSFLSFLATVLTRPSDAQLSNRREEKTNHVCSTRRSRKYLFLFGQDFIFFSQHAHLF